MMFRLYIQDNFHIQDNFNIPEIFHILYFYMNFSNCFYQTFHVLVISISWKSSISWKISSSCHIFLSCKSLNTEVWLIEEIYILSSIQYMRFCTSLISVSNKQNELLWVTSHTKFLNSCHPFIHKLIMGVYIEYYM